MEKAKKLSKEHKDLITAYLRFLRQHRTYFYEYDEERILHLSFEFCNIIFNDLDADFRDLVDAQFIKTYKRLVQGA